MKTSISKTINYIDPQTHMRVISHFSSQQTHILDREHQELWSINTFIGQKIIFLSNDGQRLVLFGHHNGGSRLKVPSSSLHVEDPIMEIYHAGNIENQLTFVQVFQCTMQEMIVQYNVQQLGGGWISMHHFMSIDYIDWNHQCLYFLYKDGTQGKVDF